jgi:hypothetical protein
MVVALLVLTTCIVYFVIYFYVRTHGAHYMHWLPVFSNIFFAIPAVMAYVYGLIDFMLLSLFMMGASVAYHIALAMHPKKSKWHLWVDSFNETAKKLLIIDYFFAMTYFVVTFVMLVQNWHTFLSLAALLVFAVSVFLYFIKWNTQYDLFHSFWHVGVSLAASLVILSVVL